MIWTTIGVAVFGILGAVGLGTMLPLEYESTAIVAIKPVVPNHLDSQFGSPIHAIPKFDEFLQWQADLFLSRRVLEAAIQSSPWQQVGVAHNISLDEIRLFRRSASVYPLAGSNDLKVVFTDTAPERAFAGARALVDSYMAIYGGSASASSRRVEILEERARQLTKRIQVIQTQLSKARNQDRRLESEGAQSATTEQSHDAGHDDSGNESLQLELAERQNVLQQINQRIETARSEVSGEPKISVVSAPEMPTKPANLRERIRFVTSAGACYAALGLAMLITSWRFPPRDASSA